MYRRTITDHEKQAFQKFTHAEHLYSIMCSNKAEEANRFGVDERSIQRDIDDIRAFLEDQKTERSTESREIIYDRVHKGFTMTGTDGSAMTNSEILAVSKILLESRAFSKKEMDSLLSKLVEGCVPLRNMKLVSDLIANEKYHYVELTHPSYDRDSLWNLGVAIRNHNLLEISYHKGDTADGCVKRMIEPVGIVFSEYYFYLNAFLVEKDAKGKYAKGKYAHKYSYPAVFRVDRIVKLRETNEKFKVSYNGRFEEGEFRKRVQFMYSGELMRVKFRFYGGSAEAALDRLPTAKIVSKQPDWYEIEAEVFGKGIIMWLLSQGERVEVLSPDWLREEMKGKLEKMVERYQ